MKHPLTFLLCLFVFFFRMEANAQTDYQPKRFQGSTSELPYNILLPKNFNAANTYPLLLFLHGAGERGSDNQKQLAHLHELFLQAVVSEKFPAIVVFPQCPTDDYWANAQVDRYPDHLDITYLPGGEPTHALRSVMELMDSLTQLRFVDKSRVYVGGLSMGGMGTFELLYRRPDMFAAAFPICGGAHPATAKPYANKVKLWVFHGDDDRVVLSKYSKEMVAALREAGGDPKFTLYKGVKHDSWKNAREEPDLLPWLFAQRKNTPLRLHSYFANNMILQREKPIQLVGRGNPNEAVELVWKGQTLRTHTDAEGALSYALPSEPAGGPHTLQLRTQDTSIVVKNILIGDVWFASGQSNMEWTLQKSTGGKEEMTTATFDQIRFLSVPREREFFPVDNWEVPLQWQTATDEKIGDYSAVAYFFSKKIHQETNVPIGILDASWGGTGIETWMNEDALRPFEEYDFDVHQLKTFHVPLRTLEKKANKAFEVWKNSTYKQGVGLEEKWYEPQADLSAWKPLEVPGYWEDQLPEYADFDGAMWYRRTFDAPEAFLAHDIRMWLSQIDDHNMCWVNGTFIGETYFSKTWTNYLIPQGLLKAKDNEIVLRVFDVGGKGGLTGLDTYFDFYPEGNSQMRGRLNGTWLVRQGARHEAHSDLPLSVSKIHPNDFPSLLYNGMVHPYRAFALKGVLWYQGEANKTNAYVYRAMFPAMIRAWRTLWNSPDLPFYYVQIANYGEITDQPSESAAAELRESQSLAQSVPRTGMASTIDIGATDDIHPLNKKDVGERLARHALKNDYGYDALVTDGPVYDSHTRRGRKLVVRFQNAKGLATTDGAAPLAFDIAEMGKPFVRAQAKILGETVILWHPKVKNPAEVRYAWAESPVVNLFNAEGLPAYPFRTDTRKLLTQDNVKNYK